MSDRSPEPAATGCPTSVTTNPSRPIAWWLFPLVVGILSRLAVLGVFALTPWRADHVGVPPVQMPFGAWDGAWFLSIAEHGYHAAPLLSDDTHGLYDFAFFPLWPAVLRLLGAGGAPDQLLAGLTANGLFVLAMVVAFRAMSRHFSVETARLGVLLLALSPAAYVGSLAYSESLNLLIVSTFCLLAGPGAGRGLVAAIGTLTRLTGPALSSTALAGPLRERRWPAPAEWLVLAAGPLAFLGWATAIAFLVGRPTAFMSGSPEWAAATQVPLGLFGVLRAVGPSFATNVVAVATYALLLAGTVFLWRRRRFELALLSTFTLLPGFVGYTASLPRYALAAVPAWFGLAELIGPRFGRNLSLLFFALQLIGAFLALRSSLIP